MNITEIQIKNFGKLHNVTIRPLSGLNVIYGENETGKSTIQQFITGMLFGIEKQRGRSGKNDTYQRYEPWNSSSFYSGGLKFTIGDKPFFLERNFYHKEKSAKLINEMDGEELSVEHGDLEMLLGGMKKTAYENTYCVKQAETETKKEFADVLQNYFVNISTGGEGGMDLINARERLRDRKKEAEQIYRQKAEARAQMLEKQQLEEAHLIKDIENLKKQQREGIENVSEEIEEMFLPEHDSNQMAEYLWDLRKKKEQQAYKMRQGMAFLVTAITLIFGILNAKAHFFGQDSNLFWTVVELFLLFGFLGGIGALYFWHQREKKLKRIRRQRMEESKEMTLSASREMERQKVQQKQQTEAKKQAVEELLQVQLAEKQTMLMNLQDEIEESQKPTEEEVEIKQQIQAYELAYNTLRKLSQIAYVDTRKQLEEEMSGILEELTHGKYDRIGLDEQMNLVVQKGTRKLFPWQLRQGVMKQMYVALRLAAGGIFTQEESMPIILDEVFESFDEKRLEAALLWLGRQKGQIFLFTCQHREMEILERNNIAYGKILLSR